LTVVRLVAVEKLSPHAEAGRVPSMTPAHFADFLADVRERDVRVPLEVMPGTAVILDGRCRWLAAKEAGIVAVPVVDAPLNGDDPVVYMIRAASKRRQLTDDQRAMLALAEMEWLAEKGKASRKEAAQSQGPRGAEGGRGRKKPLEDDAAPKGLTSLPSPAERARPRAAKSHNVSERKVKQARKVKNANPALAEKVKAGELSLSRAARDVDREDKRRDLAAKAAEADARPLAPGQLLWEVRVGDCLALLSDVPEGSVRLAFADPPYNIGIDYGEGVDADSVEEPQYYDWCDGWISLCCHRLAPDGSLWVLINDAHAAHFHRSLRLCGLTVRAWLKWYESFGINCSSNFNRCSRHLFYCVKDPKRCVFHREAVTRPSDRQEKYGDPRADPGGKVWDDVWGVNPPIPRLTGTCAERLPDFPTQLPLALLRPVVGCASDPGDLVLDPFSGSGTTGAAAIGLGRRFLGIEKSARFAELSIMRLKGVRPDG
jgi:ParB-like chromosome segregation protein Spo0J